MYLLYEKKKLYFHLRDKIRDRNSVGVAQEGWILFLLMRFSMIF